MTLTSLRHRHIAILLVSAAVLLTLLASTPEAAAGPPAGSEILLSEADSGRLLSITEDHRLVVNLPANPSAGYVWQVEGIDTAVIGRQHADVPEFISTAGDLAGGPVQQVLRFVALGEGATTLELALRRAWETEVPAVATFSLRLEAVGPFSGANVALTTVPPAEPTLEAAADITAEGLPAHFSWCEQGKCTPVRDQGMCGSCWAFATVGVMESVIKIQDGVERDLSEQYLVSCNTNQWSCNGGYWAHSYHQDRVPPGEPGAGAVYEFDFPYLAKDVPCGAPHAHHEKITSWDHVTSYGLPAVAALKQAIYAYGPVSAGVCVGEAFGRYSGGVFGTDESAKCTGANHAVVLVGWDDAQGIWYLRNSWGTRWGESGLMRIKYGTSRVGWDASHVVYGQTPYMPVGGTSQQTIRIFLPAVSRNSGAISDDSVPVPTPTPTPTPPPNPAPMAPANGGFEDGRVKWTEYSKQGWQVILDGNDLLVAPHAGSWATWLGGDHSEVASISQTVLVPSTSPYLAYWHWINSGDSCGKDVARVVVNSTVVASYDLCATHNTPGWAQRVVDLSAHAGRTVTLQIKVETDSAGVSNLYIDDVWFQSTLVAAPPPPPSDSPLTVASRPGT